jgi:RHH-type proline utilization regulon transcriptional repressor/proline dehydrogenase/delta 1-pyrroline-5-carboxylate dehydrogenase
MKNFTPELNAEIQRRGEQIFRSFEDDSGTSVFNKDWWYGRIMDWSMRNEKFKIQMFRFVDVLPYLNSGAEVSRHLKEYFAEMGEEASSVLNFGLGIGSLAPGLMASAMKKNIVQMAKMFITGESPEDAIPVLKKARDNGLCFTADLLGEATLSEKEALEYQSRYIELINWLCKDAEKWEHSTILDQDEKGPIPRVNVSVKLTALYSQVNERAWEESITHLKDRMRPIFQIAKDRNVFVNIDMEQYRFKDMTLQVFKELIMEPEFKNYPHFGIVIQAYLRDSLKDTETLVQFAKTRGTPFTVRLVKGAYWDFETIYASQQNWPVPVYTIKRESDANYEQCAEVLLKNTPTIRLAAATHNVRSIATVVTLAEKLGLDRKSFELQMLYGMAEPIKKSMVKSGYRVREYATIGELIPGMAYLVRRLLENTSNESFLRSKFADNISAEKLLADPAANLIPSSNMSKVHSGQFLNEPLLDFTVAKHRTDFRTTLAKVEKELPLRVRPVIDGKEISSKNTLNRENPSDTKKIVTQVELADVAMAEQAVVGAKAAFATWKKTPAAERSEILRKVAKYFRREKLRLMAIEIFEVGKTWSEADGDIGEAIDFCEYYAKDMLRLDAGERVSYVGGEDSKYVYQPRGISLVIAPWNFPLAILCGQVVASIVTGNTCIMKPAEQSSAIAQELMNALKEAGVPKGVVQFVPGLGEDVGRYLVQHKDVSLISFTGSKAVGLEIVKNASLLQQHQHHVKKCIIEMGGKNAIIIDSDADLDEAVGGVLYSAFGYQGQKCSACSRVIVLEENYDRFLPRLVEAAKSFFVKPAHEPSAFMGPVIDKEAFDRIQGMVQRAKSYARLEFEMPVPQSGYFVPPTIFSNVSADSEIAQEEIFGPVLAIIKAKDLDHALTIANGTQYALTGGLYSRSPMNIARVKQDYECGNLYINRGITGAMVGRHPFGGFKLSGLGSKTGGRDYLLGYLEPRVVTENTMRRGFAPIE